MKAKEILSRHTGYDIKDLDELVTHPILQPYDVLLAMEEYSQLQTSVEISKKTKIEISKVIQDIADGKVHPSTGSARLMIILKQPNNQVSKLIKKYEKEVKEIHTKHHTFHVRDITNVKDRTEAEKLHQFIQDLKQIKQ